MGIINIFKNIDHLSGTRTDLRLSFNDTNTNLAELPMNWKFLSKIWRPDTYFLNGKDSYLHKVVVPNRFIRIAPTGKISYSQRLTVTARCQMDLRKFPLDTQVGAGQVEGGEGGFLKKNSSFQACPLDIGSFGFTDDEILYSWDDTPLSMDEALELAQYQMISWQNGEKLITVRNGRKSVIFLEFHFRRAIGFYILQVISTETERRCDCVMCDGVAGLYSPVHHCHEFLGHVLAGQDRERPGDAR